MKARPLSTCRFIALGTLSTLCFAGLSNAQGVADSYPSRPVQLVLPFGPGGSSEVEGRLYAQKLTENTGKPFIVDFKPGAGSTIATGYVAKAKPDGHTILVVTISYSVTPAFYNNLPYDPAKDIAPVSLMSKRASALLVHPSLPVKTVAEYIAYAKARPGELNFGTVGAGGSPHIAGEWLHALTNSKVTFVHYKVTSAMQTDFLSGRIQVITTSVRSALPLVKSGRVRMLGVTTAERSPLLPDVPTVAEQGASGYDFSSWLGIVTTGGTPAAVVNKLQAELVKAGNAPEVKTKLSDEGTLMVLSTAEEFRRYIEVEMVRWKKLVQDQGIKLEE